MVSVARRNIAAGKGRFVFSAAGVAVATLLLSFVVGLYRGWSERLTAYLDDTPADLWVVQRGNESFFSPSVVNRRNEELVDATEGVAQASSITGRTLRLHHGEDAHDVYVMGFEAAPDGGGPAGLGGPLRMKRGSGQPRAGEIVIDDILAKTAGLDIGDEVQAAELNFRVVGISEGGNLGVTVLCFVTLDDANRLIGGYPIISYILVKAEPGKSQEVVDHIETLNPSLRVFSANEFAHSSRRVLQRTVVPVLGVVVVLVFAVGTIVVGLTIYTATIEKEREFGVMKSLGTPAARLSSIVLEQSLACCLAGFAAGIVALAGATWVTRLAVPQFVTLVKPTDVGLVFVAVLVMSLLASWLPLIRVMRVDPLTVFKA